MNARLKAAGWSYIKYLMFLAYGLVCILIGIALMTVTSIEICTAALR